MRTSRLFAFSMLGLLAFMAVLFAARGVKAAGGAPIPAATTDDTLASQPGKEAAVFAGGCFWGTQSVFERVKGSCPRLRLIWGDSVYARRGLPARVSAECDWTLEVVKRSDDVKGFVVQPKRWAVERTFAWLGRYRRLSKDYERSLETSEAAIKTAMIHIMVRRLSKTSQVPQSTAIGA